MITESVGRESERQQKENQKRISRSVESAMAEGTAGTGFDVVTRAVKALGVKK
jgi:hypothetical protein